MTSLITNKSAMNALQALRNINNNLSTTQDRISSGLKVSSGKDNAAYFQISETMKADSAVNSAINDGLTLTKNSVATARLGAETIQSLGQEFLDKVSFAQGAKGGYGEIENDLKEIVKRMETTLSQSTFNGDDLVAAGATAGTTAGAVDAATGVLTATTASQTTEATPQDFARDLDVVAGVSRAGGTFAAKTITIGAVDVKRLVTDFSAMATDFKQSAELDTGATYLAGLMASAEGVLSKTTDAATKLGQYEKSIESQQEFLTKLSDNIDSGVGSMIDANMEEEAARLQALQTQQQLATQALSIANSAPQGVLRLFQ
ncbi:flagellin [Sulfitobacter aestuarii]|uniref:Flagellin n=1 Tax=Sulfitobacter aestuarii TaxID=2161676 RepID=A0ABW5U172_9RHOB